MVFLWFSNVSCFGFSLTSWILGPSSCYHLFGASTRIRDKRHNSSCTTGSGAWHPVFTWSWFISWFINPLTIVIFPRKTVVYGIINQLVNNLAAVKKKLRVSHASLDQMIGKINHGTSLGKHPPLRWKQPLVTIISPRMVKSLNDHCKFAV